MLLQSRAYSDVLDTAKSTAALVCLVSPLGKSLELVFHQGRWSCVLAGGFLTVVLWIAHRLRLRVLTDRVRNLLAERLSERERAARELNDTLLQGMQGLILLFQGIAVQIPLESPLASKLETAISHAEQLMIEGRDSVRGLGSSSVDLGDALRSLNAEQRLPETEYSVEVTGRERSLQLLVSDEAFRIAREAVVNAFRHASAQHVWVTLAYRCASLDLTVVDDGQGIGKTSAEKNNSGQWGLMKMRDRAHKLKSRLQILNHVPSGTEVRLSVPANVAYREYTLFGTAWLRTVGDFFRRSDTRQ